MRRPSATGFKQNETLRSTICGRMVTGQRVETSIANDHRRGRRPSARAHRAILDATRELLLERDLAHLNLEQVATRAGVGKATIYRHWPTREALALEVLLEMTGEMVPARDRHDTRAELVAMLEGTLRVLAHSSLGRVMQGLFSDLALDSALAEPFRAAVVRARRAGVAEVLRRGIHRGDIRADADVDLATELLIGPVYYRLLFGGAFPADFAERVVSAFLSGYAAR
jgi:AcrR family transcriptional regulator